MIVVKYPEWVEAQLKILDELIAETYQEYQEGYAGQNVRPDEAMRIKRNLYERIRPLLDEKVRLISNCNPTYMVNGKEFKHSIKESEE